MDSPTLNTFNYEQFWLEERQWREAIKSDIASSLPSPSIETLSPPSQTSQSSVIRKRSKKVAEDHVSLIGSCSDYKATKNIVKNYAKAITNFILSPISSPYLYPILEERLIPVDDFLEFTRLAKHDIQGIDSFRNFLLIQDDDTVKVRAYKEAFKEIGIIFIRYFSINWIAHSRLKNKLIYFKYRSKILRRIRDPNSFTYLKKPKAFN